VTADREAFLRAARDFWCVAALYDPRPLGEVWAEYANGARLWSFPCDS